MPDLDALTLWSERHGVGPVRLDEAGRIERDGDTDRVKVPVDAWRRAELPGDVEGYEIVATDADGTHHHGTVDTHSRHLGHVRLIVTPTPMLGLASAGTTAP